ncbi:MAG: hypothetical protein OWQ57_04420 [Sulfobacillus sp.]|nr:hypothetical protein [Sulfobacillus sp.]
MRKLLTSRPWHDPSRSFQWAGAVALPYILTTVLALPLVTAFLWLLRTLWVAAALTWAAQGVAGVYTTQGCWTTTTTTRLTQRLGFMAPVWNPARVTVMAPAGVIAYGKTGTVALTTTIPVWGLTHVTWPIRISVTFFSVAPPNEAGCQAPPSQG